MSTSLLRLEMLYSETKVDSGQVYLGKCWGELLWRLTLPHPAVIA
jgi:hypothetical protein